MKTLIRRSGKIKGILKRPKKKLSNLSIVAAPNAPQSVIPESWIWRLELGVIFASAALILFSGVMRSRMVHLEKIIKDFTASKNINSILTKYEQSALNLGPLIDQKLKSMENNIGKSQNMTSFFDQLLSNVTDNLVQINMTVARIAYSKNFINISSTANKHECELFQRHVTEQEIAIDNQTLRVQSLLSYYLSILSRMSTVLSDVAKNAVPKDYMYVQLAGYPEPVQLWPSVKWQQMKYQESPYIQIHETSNTIYGRVSLSFPNKNDIVQNIEIDASTIPPGFAPHSAYLLKPSSNGIYDLIIDVDKFPAIQPKGRKVRLWKRI